MKIKSFECLKSIRNYKKNNAWNIRRLVDGSFGPANQRTSLLYCRLSDLWSIGVPVNRGIQPLKCEQTIACHAIIIITEQVRTLLKVLGVCEACQELEFYNELDAQLIFQAAVKTYGISFWNQVKAESSYITTAYIPI